MSNIIEILGTVTQGPAGPGGQEATGAGNFLISTGTGFGAWAENTPAQTRAALDLEVGTDVQAWDADLDTYSVNPLTAAELQQLQNIDATTITATQWGYVGSISAFGATLIDDADASAARSTLGLVIGTDVQAYDVELAALAGVTSAADKVPYFTGSGTAAVADFSAFARTLVDDADASTARGTLGLGSIATQAASNVSVTGGTITGVDLTADSADLSAFSGDLSAIVGFTPVGVSYYDDTPYEAIIRKGEPERSYYTETLNTATRGSRKEFPLRGAVCWSASQVAIVDLEGGSPELWMVGEFQSAAAFSWAGLDTSGAVTDAAVSAGLLVIGVDGVINSRVGLIRADFVADENIIHDGTSDSLQGSRAFGKIADRNSDPSGQLLKANGIVDSFVNSVAISDPLDHYPLDQYGRPAFAIAAATDGGVSVILPDSDNRGKRVTDSASTEPALSVAWAENGLIWSRGSGSSAIMYSARAGIEAADGWGGILHFNTSDVPQVNGDASVVGGGADFAIARYGVSNDAALQIYKYNWLDPDAFSLRALLTSTALSGWMPGDCKLALDFNAYAAGSVAAATPLDDDFSVDTTGDWTALDQQTFTIGGGVLTLQNNGTENGKAYQAITTVVGETYVIETELLTLSAGRGRVYTTTSAPQAGDATSSSQFSSATVGPAVVTFVALATTTYVVIGNRNDTDATSTWGPITVKRAYPDLSPATSGVIINGTLTAAAVETSADLFALSGFSASNYLEVPYSSDFDMGTGDFCALMWVYQSASAADYVLFRGDAALAGTSWDILADGANDRMVVDINGPDINGSQPILDRWVMAVLVRRGGVAELWVDGKLEGTISATANLDNSSAVVSVGAAANGVGSMGDGSIALPRIVKGYAPTPEQIRKMYRDEKKLFEENAKCFLPSDTVNSLDARDGLLLVGTEGGAVIHDVFRRLELLDSGDIGLTESGVDSVALLGGNDVALVTGSDVVARRAARDLSHPQVIDAYKYERAFSGKGYTTDATPTDIAKFPLAEGERVELRISVDTGADDGSEYGTYTRVVRARRDINGNVTVTGTDTLGTDDETTAGMDVAFAADTTAQTVDLQVTGVAATNMQWSYEAVLTLNKVV